VTSIDALFIAYQSFVRLPWQERLSGAEKLWMAVYDPVQERRLRFRMTEFAIATRDAERGWTAIDLTDWFAEWMGAHPYREEYFEDPELLETDLPRFADEVVARVTTVLDGPAVDDNTVVAVYGLASLFGLMRASTLLERVADRVRGRMLVFFPGQRDGNNYRMLDAHDGWTYLATPITGKDGD